MLPKSSLNLVEGRDKSSKQSGHLEHWHHLFVLLETLTVSIAQSPVPLPSLAILEPFGVLASAQCSVTPKQLCAHNGQIDSHHFQCTPTNVLGLERLLTRRHTLKLRFCGNKQGHAVRLLSTAVHGSFTLESFLGDTRQMTLHTVLFFTVVTHWRDLLCFLVVSLLLHLSSSYTYSKYSF